MKYEQKIDIYVSRAFHSYQQKKNEILLVLRNEYHQLRSCLKITSVKRTQQSCSSFPRGGGERG